MWKKNEEESTHPATGAAPQTSGYAPPTARGAEPRRAGGRAVIGESIRIEGDIHGDEDLLIEGEVEGKVSLEKHSVTIGPGGRIKADIHGRNINVEGKVQGNLFADEQVIVRESGEVRGNITAPRVSLEDGAKFKGAIDMEPKAGKEREGVPERPAERSVTPGGKPAASGAGGATGAEGAPGTASPASSSGGSQGASGDKPRAGASA